MASEWQTLRDQYARIARRYAEVFGPPPDLSPDVNQLRSDIAMMLDALNNYEQPDASPLGEAVRAGEQELYLQVSSAGVTAHVGLELVDDKGRKVRSRHELLQNVNLDATVRTILEGATTMALEREKKRGQA